MCWVPVLGWGGSIRGQQAAVRVLGELNTAVVLSPCYLLVSPEELLKLQVPSLSGFFIPDQLNQSLLVSIQV